MQELLLAFDILRNNTEHWRKSRGGGGGGCIPPLFEDKITFNLTIYCKETDRFNC